MAALRAYLRFNRLCWPALRERATITSEKATTDAKIYPHRSPANDIPLLMYKRNFINELRLFPPRYRDEDSVRSRLSELGKGCVALTKAVSGHHHHYTPLHIPITGLVLKPAA